MAIPKSILGSSHTLPEDPEIIYISDDNSDESGMEDANYDFENAKPEVDSVDDNDTDNNPDNDVSLARNDAAPVDDRSIAPDAASVAASDGISAIEELSAGHTANRIGAVARELATLRASLSRIEAEIYYNLVPGESPATTLQVKRKRNGLARPLCGRKGYKNFKCEIHNKFFEVNIYQKDPVNKHHWRANLARPSSSIDLGTL
ncbi:hypothetical protein BJ170DRAFT_688564 [Xylariales sp. AK1849]|nr:hypothetical protein BJ170DRAFT_688564 [Xylariales sp. AK1849]